MHVVEQAVLSPSWTRLLLCISDMTVSPLLPHPPTHRHTQCIFQSTPFPPPLPPVDPHIPLDGPADTEREREKVLRVDGLLLAEEELTSPIILRDCGGWGRSVGRASLCPYRLTSLSLHRRLLVAPTVTDLHNNNKNNIMLHGSLIYTSRKHAFPHHMPAIHNSTYTG